MRPSCIEKETKPFTETQLILCHTAVCFATFKTGCFLFFSILLQLAYARQFFSSLAGYPLWGRIPGEFKFIIIKIKKL